MNDAGTPGPVPDDAVDVALAAFDGMAGRPGQMHVVAQEVRRMREPGSIVRLPSGAEYEVQKDGSWRRLK